MKVREQYPSTPNDRVSEVVRLNLLGYKDSTIAKNLEISRQRVHQIRVKFKLPPRQPYATVCFCGKPARYKGMCRRHYANMHVTGDPFGIKGLGGGNLSVEQIRQRNLDKQTANNRKNQIRQGFAVRCKLQENDTDPLTGWGIWKIKPDRLLTDAYRKGMELAELYLSIGQGV